ncbi:MAG: NADH-quinone oxidoreductase subunit D [Actinomycetaceae bacterium]|nr:NADH-quinone oxidoreductase subunit D [Arcanobacterium sp.]MDD7505234.1 NADH-quinone oxidoreductase subunit D [Actinomycetaceae bacterium]MDY6143322.1 NADH-quinone oxidoreductase subunit D [Arcanobacterium sp.]
MPNATKPIDAKVADQYTEFEAVGGDWADIARQAEELGEEHIVVNLGPVHPATHGVLRVQFELDGETVKEVRAATGFLHTGIEKNMEYRTWTQGVAYVTRMDYVAPIFQEVGYCLAVEKLLGITDQIPQRASAIRVLLMELGRINSHAIAIGSGGNELGATSMMTLGFRAREEILKIYESITGLRMNHEFIRPGGVLEDLSAEQIQEIRDRLPLIRLTLQEMEDMTMANPMFKLRHIDVADQPLSSMMALSMTGPGVRAAGLPWDLRKTQPYCGYEKYEFDIPVGEKADAYNRVKVRFAECYESIRIAYQVLNELEATMGQPYKVADEKIAWPADMEISADGQGQSHEHVKHIMTESMEGLIHHFKLVTEGFRVPPGQVFQMIEHPKGIWGVHLISDGGTRPYRAHVRDAGFNNLQSLGVMAEGGMLADSIVALAMIDPVMGGVDR